jgi:hypothetical protein
MMEVHGKFTWINLYNLKFSLLVKSTRELDLIIIVNTN